MSRAPKVTKTALNVPPAGRNFVNNSKMGYGEKVEMQKFLDDAPTVKNEIVTDTVAPQQIPLDPALQKQLDLDVFAGTNRKNEDVRTGLGVPSNMKSTRELVQEMYDLTGDPDLARLLS
tara:strand:+ start:780 stop:1136 length:357 start_codon:yes stop_codon:yes gene_type:complete